MVSHLSIDTWKTGIFPKYREEGAHTYIHTHCHHHHHQYHHPISSNYRLNEYNNGHLAAALVIIEKKGGRERERELLSLIMAPCVLQLLYLYTF